jgi:hypothetical protein
MFWLTSQGCNTRTNLHVCRYVSPRQFVKNL